MKVQLYGGPSDGLEIQLPKRVTEVVIHITKPRTLFEIDNRDIVEYVGSSRYVKRERHKFIYKEGAIKDG